MIKYDIRLIGYINTFENVTKTNIKDCFISNKDQIIFIVDENQAGKAIGKNGLNTKKLEWLLKKKIKVIEFNKDIIKFTKNFLSQTKFEDISIENKDMQIKVKDSKTKGLLIGRDSKNLLQLEQTIKKHFSINKIKVI